MTRLELTSPLDYLDALTIIDAVMGDEWAGLTEDEINDNYLEAAEILYRSGQLSVLPGRYGRTVERILQSGN
jgi:hypothetical protein